MSGLLYVLFWGFSLYPKQCNDSQPWSQLRIKQISTVKLSAFLFSSYYNKTLQFAPGSNFRFSIKTGVLSYYFYVSLASKYKWKYQVFRVFLYITCTRDIFVGTCIIFVAIFIDFRGCSFMRKSLLFMLSSKYLTGATVRKPCTNCHNSGEILFLISFPKMMLLGKLNHFTKCS